MPAMIGAADSESLDRNHVNRMVDASSTPPLTMNAVVDTSSAPVSDSAA